MIEKTKAYVLAQCKKDTNKYGMRPFHSHFIPMVEYALELAEKRWADKEIVWIAAWLHDIWSIMWYLEDHHTWGANHAEELLTEWGLEISKINAIKHCIFAHRGSKDISRDTIEAECICDADAMSHFKDITSLFSLAIVTHKLDDKEASKFVREKLERSYQKMTPLAKDMIKDKYEAVNLLLNNVK